MAISAFALVLLLLSARPIWGKSTVFFIGGFGATDKQVTMWKNLAEKDSQYADEFVFNAISIGDSGPDAGTIVSRNQALSQALAQKINTLPADQMVILAGHSSGVALVYDIAKKVLNKSKLKIVNLDGFHPNQLQEQFEIYCWSVVDNVQPLLRARNYHVMKSCNNYREVKTSGCPNSMCLHFVLVNANASVAKVTEENFKIKGYEKLKPALFWLDQFKPETPAAKK